ncbi:12-oxophytodienoate reductase [Caballeronia sp. AZ10_KS36]|uniref:oxidoreductase n=1 Tax=Caballeronia sp. AZ10_KS36 TaxID=2921757 RepID=UPI0020292357|nr:12-oxophytodienoate reductase [Caballeronia sp. AZ10_KS36]
MSDVLFTPFTIHALTIPNRIVMSAMTRGFCTGGVPGDDVLAYYRARAAGGVGLIITEAVAVQRAAAAEVQGIPVFHTAEARAGWSSVVKAVHDEGGKIAAQLHHAGALRDPALMGASAVPNDEPNSMTVADIENTITAFGEAAATARALGFDAVEVHGANGNLIDQFLWEGRNTRSDSWGGSLIARTKFAAEVVRAVRRAVGPSFPILFRISQFKQRAFDAKIASDPYEFGVILNALSDAGVDVFHASQRRFWEPAFEPSPLNLAGWARRLSGKPAMTVGSVGLDGPDITDLLTGNGGNAGPAGLDALRRGIDEGQFDLIAVGRALLTDPTWPNKVREGRLADLRGFDLASLGSLVTSDPAAALSVPAAEVAGNA